MSEIARTGYWLRQYAIRMPNGDLYSPPVEPEEVEDYSVSSAHRDMMSMAMMSMFGPSRPKPKPRPAGPLIFSDYQSAKRLLDDMRKAAKSVGVNVYGGEIVERLCTPFSTGDLIAQFGADLQAWLETNQ